MLARDGTCLEIMKTTLLAFSLFLKKAFTSSFKIYVNL